MSSQSSAIARELAQTVVRFCRDSIEFSEQVYVQGNIVVLVDEQEEIVAALNERIEREPGKVLLGKLSSMGTFPIQCLSQDLKNVCPKQHFQNFQDLAANLFHILLPSIMSKRALFTSAMS